MASHLWTVHRPQPGVRRPVFRPTKVACHPGAGQERMRRGRIELSGDWPCLCDVTRAVGGGRCRAGGGSEAQQPLRGEALRSPLHPCVGRSQPWPLPQPAAAGTPQPAGTEARSLLPTHLWPPDNSLLTNSRRTPWSPRSGEHGLWGSRGGRALGPGEAQHAVLMVHMGPWPQRTRPAAWCCASGPCSQRAPPPPAWVPGV